MADACRTCGQPLGLRRWIGATQCPTCAEKERAERDAALAEYRSLTAAVLDPRTDPVVVGRNLPAIAERAGLDAKRVRGMNWQSLIDAFERALADEVVTRDEEERLGHVAMALGFTPTDLEQAIGHHRERMFIARVNDGRIPVLDAPSILLKRGEVAHLETAAELMKEVLIREYRGGSQGVSFRIAKGVSYRVGKHRGTMQVVGSRTETADTGTLTVTSQRAVFTGMRRSIEMRHDKLLTINVFADAIQFHVSNRQNPSMFKVDSGPMVAAAVNAASQAMLAG